MELPPSCEKLFLLVANHLHGAAQIIRLHILSPDKGWGAVRPDQVYLGMAIAEHMHMGRFVIVCEDDDAQPTRPVDRDHE
jgi:hypothetical protein